MRYVDVPAGFEEVFARAERYVADYFGDRRFEPERGEVRVGGARYVLIRAQALSRHFIGSLRRLYADQGGEVVEVGRAVLYELARSMGRADAEAFRAATGLDDPIGRLSSGPVHFAFAGWGRVSILPESRPSADADYLLIYDHPNSFESAAWLADESCSETPVCLMSAGYLAGWCEVAFGRKLVAVEVSCRAAGDERCRFVMAPPDRLEERLAELGHDSPSERGRLAGLPPFQRLHAMTEAVAELSRRRDSLQVRLSEQEQRLADLFEHAHDIIQSVDLEGRYLFVNRRWHELLGYDEQDLEHLNLFEVIQPEQRSHCRELLERLVQGEALESVGTVFVAKDGRPIPVEGNITLRRDAGNPVSTRGIFRDVSEQRAARQEMEDLLARTRSVVEHAPVGIFLYDMTGRCLEVNPAAAAMIGASREQLLAQNFRRIASWRDSGMLAAAEQCLARREGTSLQAWLTTTFGRRVCLRSRFVPVALRGRPHVLLLTEDVTAEQEAEQAQLGFQNRLLHVHQIAVEIAGATALDEVLQTAIDGCVGLVMADFGAIVLLDPRTGRPGELFASQYPLDRVPAGTEVEGRGLLGRIASGTVVHTEDVAGEGDFGGLPPWHPALAALLGMPVTDRGRTVAMLLLGRGPGAAPFSDQDRALVETVASLSAVAIRTARQVAELGELNDRLARIASTDALMNVANRRSFDEEVARFHSGALRYGHAYGVLMIDVDHFKRYNDRYGHPAGDRVLATLGRELTGSIRAEDRLFRYGGEELVALLPHQQEEGIRAAAERLRALVEAASIDHDESPCGVVTVSIGGAVFDPSRHDGELQSVIDRADAALYRAKEQGRNRVVVDGSDDGNDRAGGG